jgi:cytochrome oxidase Cu insertion factor (SCO1/SenC/PrrC family)
MSGSNSSNPGSAGSARRAETATAEPLSFAVHSLPSPTLPSATVRHGRLKMLLVLLVCAAPVIASYFTYYIIRPQGRTNHGVLIQPQRPLPAAAELPLSDLKGAPFEPSNLKGQWLLIAVAGGACDALCERQLYLQRQLRESLGKHKDRLDRVWLIDDAVAPRSELMPALQGATVLRAPAEALERWLSAASGDAQGLAVHFYLVDPLGNYMMRFPAPSEPDRIKRDLEKLMRAAASWDEPGR